MSLATRTALLLCLPLAAACGGGAPAPAAAPPPPAGPQPETGAFIATLGGDTLSGERFSRTETRLIGETFTRSPRTVSRRYDATLRPDGSIARIEVTARTLTAPPTTPATVTTFEFTADSALVRIVRGDSVVNHRMAAAYGSIPFVGGSYALYEVAVRHLKQVGRNGGEFTLLVPGTQSPSFRLELNGGLGMLSNIAGRSRLTLDGAGRLLALDGAESTQKVKLEREPDADVTGMGTAFAQREATGQGLGVLSPRDSAMLEVGGARLVVNYGRPARRGRQILGEIVPVDEVWRTGANAATGFSTTKDLMLGGTHVPAGSYTLYTLPSRTGWKLIINRQTGQWGTEYHADRDLARVDLTRRTASTPTELFTIALAGTGPGGGVMLLSWGDLELSVPFTVH